jgi:hypothetical protein
MSTHRAAVRGLCLQGTSCVFSRVVHREYPLVASVGTEAILSWAMAECQQEVQSFLASVHSGTVGIGGHRLASASESWVFRGSPGVGISGVLWWWHRVCCGGRAQAVVGTSTRARMGTKKGPRVGPLGCGLWVVYCGGLMIVVCNIGSSSSRSHAISSGSGKSL